MIEHVPWWWPMAGYALGFVMGATAGPRFAFYSKCLRRRRMGPLRGSYGPPHPTGGRVVDMYGRTIGYQPRPHGDTPIPPPEVP